jgi:hypothetical protein
VIKIKHRGNFNNAEKFLAGAKNIDFAKILAPYGQLGVTALAGATPVRSGETAASWSYEINVTRSGVTLAWTNSKMAGNVPLVILIQYGHGTGTGGYVQGVDFINPALRPVFDNIINNVWREVANK